MPVSGSAETPARDRRQRVQSAETAMAVLKALGALGGRAALSAIAARVDEHPSKVHRYLSSLVEAGLVSQDDGSQDYRLALETMLLGIAAMRQADPIRLAEGSLLRLREALGVTCFLAILGNKGPTIVRFEEPGLPVTVNVRVGSVLSMLWSATGRVFLGLVDARSAFKLAERELAGLTASQRALLDGGDPIGTLRQAVQRDGCAAVRDVNLKGISAVSAPVFDHAGGVCAALTALGASGGFDPSLDGPIAAAVRAEAVAVSTLLGYRGADTDRTTIDPA
ncbi:IclR family transcriptional regulator [Chitinasiproducens palmae]|nr:IclR family transcriptional regulator [Chitinasiproducens palmae]